MKVSKKLLVVLIVVCVVSVISAFKNLENKEQSPQGVKYEYAIIYVKYEAFNATSINIEYSNGQAEDYKKMNHISSYDLETKETMVITNCFNYLNQQNYELRSTSMVNVATTLNKVYYFSRKVS
jgi:hypothetical protein